MANQASEATFSLFMLLEFPIFFPPKLGKALQIGRGNQGAIPEIICSETHTR